MSDGVTDPMAPATHYSFGQMAFDPERGCAMVIVHLGRMDGGVFVVQQDRTIEFRTWKELADVLGRANTRSLTVMLNVVCEAAAFKAIGGRGLLDYVSTPNAVPKKSAWWKFWQ